MSQPNLTWNGITICGAGDMNGYVVKEWKHGAVDVDAVGVPGTRGRVLRVKGSWQSEETAPRVQLEGQSLLSSLAAIESLIEQIQTKCSDPRQFVGTVSFGAADGGSESWPNTTLVFAPSEILKSGSNYLLYWTATFSRVS